MNHNYINLLNYHTAFALSRRAVFKLSYSLCLLETSSLGLTFTTHNTTSPISLDFFHTFVVVRTDSFGQLLQSVFVLLLYIGHSYGSSCLLVNQLAQACLTFDNTIRYSHLPTQGRQPDDNFNRIHIMCNAHQLCFL